MLIEGEFQERNGGTSNYGYRIYPDELHNVLLWQDDKIMLKLSWKRAANTLLTVEITSISRALHCLAT